MYLAYEGSPFLNVIKTNMYSACERYPLLRYITTNSEVLPTTNPVAMETPRSRRNTFQTLLSYAAGFILFLFLLSVLPMLDIARQFLFEQNSERANATSLTAATLESKTVRNEFAKRSDTSEFWDYAHLAESDKFTIHDLKSTITITADVDSEDFDSRLSDESEDSDGPDDPDSASGPDPKGTGKLNAVHETDGPDGSGKANDMGPPDHESPINPVYPTSPDKIVPLVSPPEPVTTPTSTQAPLPRNLGAFRLGVEPTLIPDIALGGTDVSVIS